jgi:hypothetical protein
MDRYDFNSTVSWGAILAGGFTAAAVTLIVVAFGGRRQRSRTVFP